MPQRHCFWCQVHIPMQANKIRPSTCTARLKTDFLVSDTRACYSREQLIKFWKTALEVKITASVSALADNATCHGWCIRSTERCHVCLTLVSDENVSVWLVAPRLQDHADLDVVWLGQQDMPSPSTTSTYRLTGHARHPVLDDRQHLATTHPNTADSRSPMKNCWQWVLQDYMITSIAECSAEWFTELIFYFPSDTK